MKKPLLPLLTSIFFTLLIAFLLVSCEKEPLTYDLDHLQIVELRSGEPDPICLDENGKPCKTIMFNAVGYTCVENKKTVSCPKADEIQIKDLSPLMGVHHQPTHGKIAKLAEACKTKPCKRECPDGQEPKCIIQVDLTKDSKIIGKASPAARGRLNMCARDDITDRIAKKAFQLGARFPVIVNNGGTVPLVGKEKGKPPFKGCYYIVEKLEAKCVCKCVEKDCEKDKEGPEVEGPVELPPPEFPHFDRPSDSCDMRPFGSNSNEDQENPTTLTITAADCDSKLLRQLCPDCSWTVSDESGIAGGRIDVEVNETGGTVLLTLVDGCGNEATHETIINF